MPFEQRYQADVGLAPLAGSPQLRGAERDRRGEHAIFVADAVGQADRLLERTVGLADPAGGPAHLTELNQQVTADGVGIWPHAGSGECLVEEPGGVLPGPLASRAGGRLPGVAHGLA